MIEETNGSLNQPTVVVEEKKLNWTTELATSTGGALALAVLCNKAHSLTHLYYHHLSCSENKLITIGKENKFIVKRISSFFLAATCLIQCFWNIKLYAHYHDASTCLIHVCVHKLMQIGIYVYLTVLVQST